MALATQSLIDVQLQHNGWAIRQIINKSADLSDKEFKMTFGVGPGSLQLVLAHVVESMFFFADNFGARPYAKRERFKQRSQTPQGLLELLDEAEQELIDAIDAYLDQHDLDEGVFWPSSEEGAVTAAVALSQIFDHGTHHRAQCLNIMRRLGNLDGLEVSPLKWADTDDEE